MDPARDCATPAEKTGGRENECAGAILARSHAQGGTRRRRPPGVWDRGHSSTGDHHGSQRCMPMLNPCSVPTGRFQRAQPEQKQGAKLSLSASNRSCAVVYSQGISLS